MTRKLPRPLQVILALLPLCSTACTRTVQVQVPVPAPVCPLPPLPPFPDPDARACAPDVCLPPAGAVAIWEWSRAVQRWAELATVCLDARS